MGMLERLDWYDLARSTSWTPSYVAEAELFPPELSGDMGIPMSEWEKYDEPYKVTYPEYVKTQREKDAGAYSVPEGLDRQVGAPGRRRDRRLLRCLAGRSERRLRGKGRHKRVPPVTGSLSRSIVRIAAALSDGAYGWREAHDQSHSDRRRPDAGPAGRERHGSSRCTARGCRVSV